MARYTGADCKLCRREKTKLFLKGAKCDSPKCPIEIRPYPPGEHGRNRPKEGDYLQQIREKQKARRIYGILERQFHGYYEEAARKHGRTGETMLQLLERRLDNVVYRAGFAKSRDMARQLVRHGHFTVNGKKVDIPSYRVSENDIVEVVAKSLEMTPFVIARAEAGERIVPAWLEVVPDKMRILVHSLPVRAQIDTQVQEQLIVEYYSKMYSSYLAGHGGPPGTWRRKPSALVAGQIAGRRKGMQDAHRTTSHPHRGAGRRVPFAVYHRAARARIRVHDRQLGPPHSAVLDSRCCCHQHQDRGGPARVLHRARRVRGRHRHHPEPQGARRLL